jgi:hypothetical protein
MDTSTLVGVVGTVVTAVGVFVAVITIIVALRIENVQKDVEAVLKLSSHLTAWHDEVIRVVNLHDVQALLTFIRNRKYQGPLNLLLALLGDSRKFKELVRRTNEFEREAQNAKGLALQELEGAQVDGGVPSDVQLWLQG